MFYMDSYPENKMNFWEQKCIEINKTSLDDLEQRIWDLARMSQEPPHLGNIRSLCVLDTLEQVLLSKYPELLNSDLFDRFINGCDTHFYINNNAITDEESLIDTIVELSDKPV